jgi:hypothetical protein
MFTVDNYENDLTTVPIAFSLASGDVNAKNNPGFPRGYFAYTISGITTFPVRNVTFCKEQSAIGTQSLRYDFEFPPTGNREFRFGRDDYRVALAGRTDIVFQARTTLAGNYRLIIHTSGTGNTERTFDFTFTASQVNQWVEFTVPISTIAGSAGVNSFLETVYFRVANSNNQGIAGTLWVDNIRIK